MEAYFSLIRQSGRVIQVVNCLLPCGSTVTQANSCSVIFKLPLSSMPSSQQKGGRQNMKEVLYGLEQHPSSSTFHFYSHFTAWNLVIWSHLIAKGSGKRNPGMCLGIMEAWILRDSFWHICGVTERVPGWKNLLTGVTPSSLVSSLFSPRQVELSLHSANVSALHQSPPCLCLKPFNNFSLHLGQRQKSLSWYTNCIT